MASDSPPDIALLTARMAKGEEEAYRQFYGLYFDRLLRYLLVVVGNEETAREALQMTLLRVARHARKFDSEAAFWSWLTVLARSALADEGRRSRRYLRFLERFFQHRQIHAATSGNETDAQLLELLQRNLAALADDERALLERKYFEGQTVLEIAAQTESSQKAVESRLLRVRRKLKDLVLAQLKHEQ